MTFDLVTACPRDTQAQIDRLLEAVEGATIATGLRKLWRHEVGDGSDPRWTLARPLARPTQRRRNVSGRHMPVEIAFSLPDPKFYRGNSVPWLTANGYTASTLADNVVPEDIAPYFNFAQFAVAATPYNFTIENEGDLYSQHVIFRLDSAAVNGFTNPQLVNNTTGQQWSSTEDGGTADTILSVHSAPGLGQARRSTDAGVNWSDVTTTLTLGTTQAVCMELAAGTNSFTYTDGGAPNFTLYVWFLHAFRN